jgi:predicted Rdx family selenoprotein
MNKTPYENKSGKFYDVVLKEMNEDLGYVEYAVEKGCSIEIKMDGVVVKEIKKNEGKQEL